MTVADVIATGAGVIASCDVWFFYWLMLFPNGGRCHGHLYCNVVADVIAQWQME